MHQIVAAVYRYLGEVTRGDVPGPKDEAVATWLGAMEAAIKRQLAPRDRKTFTLRMSNLGRPLCQLQMEQAGVVGEETNNEFGPMRNAYGDITEAMAVLIMREAGINIVAEQQEVAYSVAGTVIKGTLDVIIDLGSGPKVYDIKSCSKYAFTNKMHTFQSLLSSGDSFGYVVQGYGYSAAVGLPFGGLILINKESGEWNVICPPIVDDDIRTAALKTLETNVIALMEKHPFQRCFEDTPEIWYKKPTGNRILNNTCSYCPYKNACWPGLKLLEQIPSTAANPRMYYYTHIDDKYKEEEINVDPTTI